MSNKKAITDHPIHELLAQRWSPCTFQDKSISEADICSLFEAARWAASSYNEQPWHYIVAVKENFEDFQRLLSCLTEGNQGWAQHASMLVLNVVSLRFARGDGSKENRTATHDLGLAVGNLLVEATARGLSVHQMVGIVPEKAHELFQIPEGYAAWTAMAIGYRGDPEASPENLKRRDLTPRQRKPLSQFVFSGKWGSPSPLVLKR